MINKSLKNILTLDKLMVLKLLHDSELISSSVRQLFTSTIFR